MKNFLAKTLVIAFAAFLIIGPSASTTYAEFDDTTGTGFENTINGIYYGCPQSDPQCEDGGIQALIQILANILLPVAIGVIAVPLIMINGYKLMTSQGDPQKAKDGKEGLTAALVGLAFLLLSMTILRIILNSFFGA